MGCCTITAEQRVVHEGIMGIQCAVPPCAACLPPTAPCVPTAEYGATGEDYGYSVVRNQIQPEVSAQPSARTRHLVHSH